MVLYLKASSDHSLAMAVTCVGYQWVLGEARGS
jgi:hypothetical protein